MITLSNNNLTILCADPFGCLPKLKYFSLINCQLEAIDENLIDNTGAMQLLLTDNFYVNETIIDNSAMRYSVRIILSEYFDNYTNMVGRVHKDLWKNLELENQIKFLHQYLRICKVKLMN